MSKEKNVGKTYNEMTAERRAAMKEETRMRNSGEMEELDKKASKSGKASVKDVDLGNKEPLTEQDKAFEKQAAAAGIKQQEKPSGKAKK